MNTKKFAWIVGALFVLAVCLPARATIFPNPLATHTEVMAGSSITTASTFEIRLGSGFGFGINSPIFDSLTFTAADAGKVFPVTQAQDPDFNGLKTLLLNGVSDDIELDLSFDNFQSISYGLSNSEKNFFAPLPAGNNGIDFQGFPIDNIALRLDSVSIMPSSFSIQATFLVNSAPVPEPSTAALAALAGGLLFLLRRKAR